MARVAKFDWDDGNTGHIARHGVTQEEVEQASPTIRWWCSLRRSAAEKNERYARG